MELLVRQRPRSATHMALIGEQSASEALGAEHSMAKPPASLQQPTLPGEQQAMMLQGCPLAAVRSYGIRTYRTGWLQVTCGDPAPFVLCVCSLAPAVSLRLQEDVLLCRGAMYTSPIAGPNTPELGSLTRRALDTGTTAEAAPAQVAEAAEGAAGLPLADQAVRSQTATSGKLPEHPQQKRRGVLRRLLRRASSSFSTKIQQ